MTQTLDEPKISCKAKLPMPALLHVLGLGEYAKPSCRSPLRKEKNASWGIFHHGGQWFYKDHGTGETGDEIDFIGDYFGVSGYRERLAKYCELAGVIIGGARHIQTAPRPLPDRSVFGEGTPEQFATLAQLRGIGLAGIQFASKRGVFKCGRWNGHECWGVTDRAAKVMEIRRLDGKPFPAVGDLNERKSHAIRYSQKAWPLGILEAQDFPKIALVEGMPDFLEAHHLTIWEGKPDVAPVSMLSASPRIADDALKYFRGKRVRIFPHCECGGIKGAARWYGQLTGAGAIVDLFDFTGLRKRDGTPVNDLLDFSAEIDPNELISKPNLQAVLP